LGGDFRRRRLRELLNFRPKQVCRQDYVRDEVLFSSSGDLDRRQKNGTSGEDEVAYGVTTECYRRNMLLELEVLEGRSLRVRGTIIRGREETINLHVFKGLEELLGQTDEHFLQVCRHRRQSPIGRMKTWQRQKSVTC
jgi:hypothetical protein